MPIITVTPLNGLSRKNQLDFAIDAADCLHRASGTIRRPDPATATIHRQLPHIRDQILCDDTTSPYVPPRRGQRSIDNGLSASLSRWGNKRGRT
ncbi:hypothetical protein [Antarcticirhabdus aurantiaca]|uniref:Uncharacterized protein n=1 Tax=Antarcticirhabdus aurantiaca TaxID=2606717 RepID=A0ACD4NRV2_9HYPH|nr:hypothetical protein [Antarcticirhabdus aurantiaca]WAJ29524.1 hypothetical protein OXU80_04620 [Jeongeuplla avenae]